MMRVWFFVGLGIAALAALVFWLADARPGILADEGNQIRLTQLSLILVLVGSGLVVRWRNRPTLKWLQHGLIWVGLGLVLVVGYSYRTDATAVWTRVLAELMPGHAVESSDGEVIIRAANNGHFYIDAKVDGARIRFLVDTGASRVVLNHRDARIVGFDMDKLAYTQRTRTANGIGMSAPIRLRTINIGPISVEDIRASVNKAPMSTSLLGVSFLERLSGYSVIDRTLKLKQ
jgi:aspartyl protease family protein